MNTELMVNYDISPSSDRKNIREFVEKIDVFMKEQLSGWFNKLITTALYPPDGSTPATIPELEAAWETLVPQVHSRKRSKQVNNQSELVI